MLQDELIAAFKLCSFGSVVHGKLNCDVLNFYSNRLADCFMEFSFVIIIAPLFQPFFFCSLVGEEQGLPS
jgi:hypothetical protein